MHTINLNNKNIRTDLITEQNNNNITSDEKVIEGVKVINSKENSNLYTTLYYNDITDKDNYKKVEKILIDELKKYITQTRKDTTLIVGLGNRNSTPDSLGPKVIDNILVTRYLFQLGDVEEGYSNTCSFIPNVTGNTGIETANIIKTLIEDIKPKQVIIIDALKTNTKDKLNKTIQITNTGIHPGSGIGNTRKEISSNNMNTKIIAIGVPTVVEIDENLIVCTADIDYLIEKLSFLISSSINKLLHKNYIRQNN